MPTIGLTCNLYNEANALPGWLEAGFAMFDHVCVFHSGPGGKESTDGTMEILKKWRVPVTMGSIDDGFGVVRTLAIRSCPTDYVALLDADERMMRFVPMMGCDGASTPPDIENMVLQQYDNREDVQDGNPSNFENIHLLGASLRVKMLGVMDQGQFLRDIIANNQYDSICAIRRHWHDFSWSRPTQNWQVRHDYQYRIVRNDPSIYFDPTTKMHESLVGASRIYQPTAMGPYIDHFHLAIKRLEPEQRREDIKVYDWLSQKS